MDRDYMLPYRERVLYVFTLVGVVLVAVFGISVHVSEGNYGFALFETVLALVALGNLVLYRTRRNYDLASTVILALMVIILSFLVVTGGYRGTGILWMYTFPPLSLFLKGFVSAMLWNALLVGMLLSLVLLDQAGALDIHYDFIYIRQSLGAYFGVLLLSSFYSFMVTRLFRMLRDRAVKDHLTGVYNRLFMFESLERIVEMVKRTEGRTYCLVYIDLDNFKSVNDRFGHLEGDRVLRKVAELLRSSFRKGDMVGRVGGDEFLILVYDCGRVKLGKRLELLVAKVEDLFQKHRISFSYGIVEIPTDGVEVSRLLKLADRRMYEMKRLKGNQRRGSR